MGPRSGERGNHRYSAGLQQASELQWGRVLVNAETRLGWQSIHPLRVLQWGRVLVNAETWSRIEGKLDQLELQWGRVLVNAETART